MSACDQLREFYESYALGILEGEERAAVEAHLATGCPACAEEIARARSLVSQLAYLAPEAEPPASLRSKVLEAAGEPRRSWIPAWAWVAAAAVVFIALLTAYRVRQLNAQLAELESQVRSAQAQTQIAQAERNRLDQLIAALSAPGTVGVDLKPSAGSLPGIRAYWHAQAGIVLTGRQLPVPAADRTYQLWIVPKKGVPISVGIFRPDASGKLVFAASSQTERAQAAALAITEEPAGGQPQPTSKPLWVASLSETLHPTP